MKISDFSQLSRLAVNSQTSKPAEPTGNPDPGSPPTRPPSFETIEETMEEGQQEPKEEIKKTANLFASQFVNENEFLASLFYMTATRTAWRQNSPVLHCRC